MVMTASAMVELGTKAPDFSLPDVRDGTVSLSDFDDAKALLVVFMCNHCPFVKHVLNGLLNLAREYQRKEVSVVGISSNDVEAYPEDGPEMMAEFAERMGFPFPYLYDATQEVAKSYHAACTPDFFLFDKDRKLAYRGQMDDSRPGGKMSVTGADLRAALDATLAGRAVPGDQRASMGCNIKWKPGNEPDYA
jgi:peroxiredoxin